MTDLPQRDAQVLAGVVREYIRTARPVGSTALVQVLGLDVSPATIRHVLSGLEDAGYIMQPHTSAGRVPTDAGYRYYVDRLADEVLPLQARRQLARQVVALIRDSEDLPQVTARVVAPWSGYVAVGIARPAAGMYEAGLRELLRHIGDDDVAMLHELSAILDDLDEVAAHLTPATDEATRVYIGQEIPFRPAQYTSLVVRPMVTQQGERLITVIVGPKRMAYRRNVSLLETLAQILKTSAL